MFAALSHVQTRVSIAHYKTTFHQVINKAFIPAPTRLFKSVQTVLQFADTVGTIIEAFRLFHICRGLSFRDVTVSVERLKLQ